MEWNIAAELLCLSLTNKYLYIYKYIYFIYIIFTDKYLQSFGKRLF